MGWTDKEADETYRVLGSILLGIIIVVGLFYLHIKSNGSLLSPEIIMAIINIPAIYYSHREGKKAGREEAFRQFHTDKNGEKKT